MGEGKSGRQYCGGGVREAGRAGGDKRKKKAPGSSDDDDATVLVAEAGWSYSAT